jgi:hypothetical protein
LAFKRGCKKVEVATRLDAARRVFRGLKPTATIMASRCKAGDRELFAPTELEASR